MPPIIAVMVKPYHLARFLIKPMVCKRTISGASIDHIFKELEDRGVKEHTRCTSDLNLFKLFKLDQRFNIDEVKLKREMRNLQVLVHPDKFVGADSRSMARAATLSALVNDANKILSHPYERAKHLLALMSHKTPDEIEESLDKLQMDPNFLSKMMDIREIIESDQSDELRQLNSEMEKELIELIRELNDDFEHNRDVDNILRKIGKLKFVANCRIAIADKLGSYCSYT